MDPERTLLISYDGSEDARTALDAVARLMPGATATVLTVWEPERHYDGGHGSGAGLIGVYSREPEADGARERAASACATEGAEVATAAGLQADARTVERQDSVARAILDVADEVGAGVVVLGTRGLSGVRSFLLGSVSHAVLQQADRAVMVVPSASVAGQRQGLARAVESEG